MPAFKTFVTYENSMYGLPFDGESTALFYRTDLFQAAGIAAAADHLAGVRGSGEEADRPGQAHYGDAMFASSPEAAYYWYPWLWQDGGKLLSDDGKEVLFNYEEAKSAAEFYVKLAQVRAEGLPQLQLVRRPPGVRQRAGRHVRRRLLVRRHARRRVPRRSTASGRPRRCPKGSAGCGTTIAGDALVMFSQGKNSRRGVEVHRVPEQARQRGPVDLQVQGRHRPFPRSAACWSRPTWWRPSRS